MFSWVVIGGANGFLVNPAQFSYVDRSFTDPGKVQPPNPAGTGSHRGHFLIASSAQARRAGGGSAPAWRVTTSAWRRIIRVGMA
jgi:hypothetical protein